LYSLCSRFIGYDTIKYKRAIKGDTMKRPFIIMFGIISECLAMEQQQIIPIHASQKSIPRITIAEYLDYYNDVKNNNHNEITHYQTQETIVADLEAATVKEQKIEHHKKDNKKKIIALCIGFGTFIGSAIAGGILMIKYFD
jgi:hypothetical protein